MALTAAAWRRLLLPLLDEPQTWMVRSRRAFATPVWWTLRGVLAEGSSRRDQVYVWHFHMPLFVPADELTLDHGARVPRGSSAFAVDDPRLVDVLGRAIAAVVDDATALRAIAATESEEGRYAPLLLGEPAEAERRLARPFAPGDDRPFVRAARDRMAAVRRLHRSQGAEAAVGQLRLWRDATAKALAVDR